MRLSVLLPVSCAISLTAPCSVTARAPGPKVRLESCDAIDPAFWAEDGRLFMAQLEPRCDAVVRLPPEWTARSDDHWNRFRCTFVRRSGAECGELWTTAFTCRCERGGRERAFGKVINCGVEKGQLHCRTNCTRKGCAQGAILPALAPTDLPQPDLQACFDIPRPPDLWTDLGDSAKTSFSRCVAGGLREHPSAAGCALLERTIDADVGPADRCYARLAAQERQPRWCDQIVHSRRSDGCFSELASTLPDPALCDRLRESAEERQWDLDMGPRATEERRQYRLEDVQERRRSCRERAAGGPWPRPMQVVRHAPVHDRQNCPVEGSFLQPGTDVIANGRARWNDGTTSDTWLEVTFRGQVLVVERSALVDAGRGAPERPQGPLPDARAASADPTCPRPSRESPSPRPPPSATPLPSRRAPALPRSTISTSPRELPDPKPLFFVSDTFVDDQALDPGSSPLSCRQLVLEHLADHFSALEKQAQQRDRGHASDPRPVAGDELRILLSGLTGCRELDARLTHWGLFVEGRAAAWRKMDPSPALELAVVPATCEADLLLEEVRLRFPREPLLIAALPERGRAGEAPYQSLGPLEGAAAHPKAAGTQRIVLSTPRLGGIGKAFVEKRVVSWTGAESEARPELVVERATLILERDVGGKQARVEVFHDEGVEGKYTYSDADVRDVHLLDADFDGDVDVLLSGSNGARYLVLLERGRPRGKPIQLLRPRDPMDC